MKYIYSIPKPLLHKTQMAATCYDSCHLLFNLVLLIPYTTIAHLNKEGCLLLIAVL